ncbi:unnamed protein product [Mesocestoides corti]|uniref:X-box-binding protein 1 n=1 Tax=Mesocestoides corti TaxID=53468 RepID=A0A0R3UMN4_MESCO|nr:unnamed protein product [Mesocestoides corti]
MIGEHSSVPFQLKLAMINFSHQPAYGLILPGKRNQCTTVICPSYVAGRKRARLDFLSEEEKAIRRKLLNREAAQKARDRKKDTIRSMEQCIQDLQVENFKLRQTINSLKNKCRDHELKFISLRQEIKAFTEISKCKRRRQIEPIESAVLIPQQQVLVLCLLALSYLHLLSRVQVTIPSSQVSENSADEVEIGPIDSSPSLYDTIYRSFQTNELFDDISLAPSSCSDDSLDDILQCLGADKVDSCFLPFQES